jgi:hypothetical protein
MRRAFVLGLFLSGLIGCQAAPEQVPFKPLPANGPISFADLYERARKQAEAANSAFFDNKWADVETVANSLDETARRFDNAEDVPARHKDNLAIESGDLRKEVAKLKEAAVAKDAKKANEAMARISFLVRQLGLKD